MNFSYKGYTRGQSSPSYLSSLKNRYDSSGRNISSTRTETSRYTPPTNSLGNPNQNSMYNNLVARDSEQRAQDQKRFEQKQTPNAIGGGLPRSAVTGNMSGDTRAIRFRSQDLNQMLRQADESRMAQEEMSRIHKDAMGLSKFNRDGFNSYKTALNTPTPGGTRLTPQQINERLSGYVSQMRNDEALTRELEYFLPSSTGSRNTDINNLMQRVFVSSPELSSLNRSFDRNPVGPTGVPHGQNDEYSEGMQNYISKRLENLLSGRNNIENVKSDLQRMMANQRLKNNLARDTYTDDSLMRILRSARERRNRGF